jgi:2-polyprenyl-3-methyl-5-hydroxy-6-metoxy-1,4-benzoquinol methylase
MNNDRINDHYYGDPLHPTTQRCRQRIHWICNQVEGARILDVGCSQGIVCLLLGREGYDCTGVDAETPAIEVARAALAKEEAAVQKRVHFVLADATQLPFEDNAFDSIVLCEILEHLTHPEKVLREVRRVLKEQGKLIVSVPYGLLAHADHKHSLYPISLLETLRPFFRSTLLEAPQTNQLVYCGVKDSASILPQPAHDELFALYVRWEKHLEQRCLTTEAAMQESNSRFGEQIRKLTGEAAANTARLKQLQETLAEREKQLHAAQVAVNEMRAATANREVELGRSDAALATLRTELASAKSALVAAQQQQINVGKKLAVKAALLIRANIDLVRSNAFLSAATQEREFLRTTLATRDAELTIINANWQHRLTQPEALLGSRLREGEGRWQETVLQREGDVKRALAQHRVRALVRAVLPADARVLVISKGDDDLLKLDGRVGWHFPQTSEGVYAGHHPADSAEAIEHLETLKAKGAGYLLIPAAAFWWLEFYADFCRHLETNCRLLAYDVESCAVFGLTRAAVPAGQIALSLRLAERQPARVTKAAASAAPGVAGAVPAPKPIKIDPAKPTIGGVFDEFTAACFRPDCNLITFRPDNWRRVLDQQPINLLLTFWR